MFPKFAYIKIMDRDQNSFGFRVLCVLKYAHGPGLTCQQLVTRFFVTFILSICSAYK